VKWSILYIDDFLKAGPPNSDKYQEYLSLIKAVCAHLGFPLKWEKVEGAACTIQFLGIVLDIQQLEVMLPEEKAQQFPRNAHAGRGRCSPLSEN